MAMVKQMVEKKVCRFASRFTKRETDSTRERMQARVKAVAAETPFPLWKEAESSQSRFERSKATKRMKLAAKTASTARMIQLSFFILVKVTAISWYQVIAIANIISILKKMLKMLVYII